MLGELGPTTLTPCRRPTPVLCQLPMDGAYIWTLHVKQVSICTFEVHAHYFFVHIRCCCEAFTLKR